MEFDNTNLGLKHCLAIERLRSEGGDVYVHLYSLYYVDVVIQKNENLS